MTKNRLVRAGLITSERARVKGKVRLFNPLYKLNHYIKFKKTPIFFKYFLTDRNLSVFYEGTVAAGITLNNEKFGMLYGNRIRRLIRKRVVVSIFEKCA